MKKNNKEEVVQKAYQEYMEKGCSAMQISLEYGFSPSWLNTHIRLKGLPKNSYVNKDSSKNKMAKIYQYWVDHKDMRRVDVCLKFGITKSAFSHYTKRNNLPKER
ncbi:MAG: hypothetical protein ACRCZ0_10965 [Cetobacterium sp.]